MLIKKIFFTLLIISLCAFPVKGANSLEVSAKSAVILNRQTKQVVFEKNAYEKRSMASTTKIMTALIACESGRLYECVTISEEMCGAEGTSVGLKAGYKLRLYDLVCAMMLESGNDAANAVAIFLGKTAEGFSKMMNDKAYEIGMCSTNFVTASGLDHENHYTTAYDMALLGAYAMDNAFLSSICSLKSSKVEYIKPDIVVNYSNHNRLLYSYDGVYGIKTGFTKKSGRCLVSAAKNEKGDFVCVTLNAPNDWNDHKKMFDYAFSNSVTDDYYLRIPDEVTVMGGVFSKIMIETKSPYRISLSKNGKITQKVYLSSFVYAPIKKGDILGKVILLCDNKQIASVPIIAKESCNSTEPTYKEKKSIFIRLKNMFSSLF